MHQEQARNQRSRASDPPIAEASIEAPTKLHKSSICGNIPADPKSPCPESALASASYINGHKQPKSSPAAMAQTHLATALAALAVLAVLSHWIPAEAKRSKTQYREITFFLHDRLLIPDPSAFFVVPPLGGLPANVSGHSLFGGVVVFDDLLTVSPDPDSQSVGWAKGFYVWDNNDDAQPALELVFTVVFNDASGFPPGSTISYRGFTPIFSPVRESSIVGGTGLFRLARGWSESTVFSYSGVSAIDNFTSFVYYGGY